MLASRDYHCSVPLTKQQEEDAVLIIDTIVALGEHGEWIAIDAYADKREHTFGNMKVVYSEYPQHGGAEAWDLYIDDKRVMQFLAF